jgi:hypothetical protein
MMMEAWCQKKKKVLSTHCRSSVEREEVREGRLCCARTEYVTSECEGGGGDRAASERHRHRIPPVTRAPRKQVDRTAIRKHRW